MVQGREFGRNNMLRQVAQFIAFIHNKYRFRGKQIKISSNSVVSGTTFEGQNRVGDGVSLRCSYCGCFTYIGKNSDLSYTKIGRFCSIADYVCVCRGNHPLGFVTTHPSFYYDTTKQIGYTIHRGEPLYDKLYKYPEGERLFQVIIGNDVWIGSHVLILGGVRIGDGAVIGSGTVVTKDVEPYSIVAGNPARVIRKRFADNVIDKLQERKWWNLSLEDICSSYKVFTNCDSFFSEYDKFK